MTETKPPKEPIDYWERGCARKVPYNEASAKFHAKRHRQYPYKCRYCGHWHLSKNPPNE